jgi:peptide/nickel transport system permease protein
MRSIHQYARLLAVPLLLASFLSDFLSPSAPDAQDLNQFYAPPARVRFVDMQGRFHWRPFVYRMELVDSLDATYREANDQAFPLEFFCEGYRYRFMGLIPSSRHLLGTGNTGTFHPWGTDALGRDVLARTLAGARNSMMVLLFGITIYFMLGVTIGTIAGAAGGWTDTLLMRFSEFVLALPALYLVLAVRALLPPNMPFWQTVFLTAGTIAAVAWPPMARGVRGQILQIKKACYVEAARMLGGSPWHIFRRHMLPAMATFALAQTAVAAPLFILGEVVLSFLNVGFHDSGSSWGTMLRGLAQDPRVLTDFWWNLSPLAFVFATLLCLSGFSRRMRTRGPAQLA